VSPLHKVTFLSIITTTTTTTLLFHSRVRNNLLQCYRLKTAIVELPDKQKLDKEMREFTSGCLEKQRRKDPGDEVSFLGISLHDVMKGAFANLKRYLDR